MTGAEGVVAESAKYLVSHRRSSPTGYRFTVKDYHRMAEAEAFHVVPPDAR